MRRRLLIILAAIIASGPTVSVLYLLLCTGADLAAEYVDATWAIVWIICGYVAPVIVFDRVLQVLRPVIGGGTAWCFAAERPQAA